MRLARLALALLAAGLSACGEGVPLTAPTGAILTIEALPKSIPAIGGASTITVIGFRSADPDGGGTLPNGTQIFFTTDLGVIEDRVTMQQGIARATLRSDGKSGTATVTAVSGGGNEALTTTVQIGSGVGEIPVVITVTANPVTLGPGDFSSEIVATLTDSQGNPLASVPVIFSTTSGALASSGSVLRTNANGQAFDRLTLLDNQNATVTVTSGAASSSVTVVRGDFGDPLIDSVSPSSGVRGATLFVTVTGQRFQPGATASLGAGIAVNDVDWISSETLRIQIRIDPSASTGTRTLTVTNPDGGSGTLASAFVVQ